MVAWGMGGGSKVIGRGISLNSLYRLKKKRALKSKDVCKGIATTKGNNAGFLWFPLRPLGCTYRGQQCPLVVYVQNWNLFSYSFSTLPVIVYSNLLLIKVKEIIGRIHWIKSRPK